MFSRYASIGKTYINSNSDSFHFFFSFFLISHRRKSLVYSEIIIVFVEIV